MTHPPAHRALPLRLRLLVRLAGSIRSALLWRDQVHCELHRLGHKIMRLHASGQRREAQTAAQSLLLCKDRLWQHLDHLQREVRTPEHA